MVTKILKRHHSRILNTEILSHSLNFKIVKNKKAAATANKEKPNKLCFGDLNISKEPLIIQMWRNSVSMQYLFEANVNRIKITLGDHPESDGATHNEKTVMRAFSWWRNALHTTLHRSYYISLHHMVVRQGTIYGNPDRQRETLRKEK